jgi:hypothetical protein
MSEFSSLPLPWLFAILFLALTLRQLSPRGRG